MANDNLQTADAPANDPTIWELATDVQVQAGRIMSLADAIDDVTDMCVADEDHRRRLGRALDYVHLISEAAKKAAEAGERIESRGFLARRMGIRP